MRELLAFTVPSMGIWLASPLLSLVDVSVVGLGSTLELAALGPATGVCDSSAYAFTFLAVATTSLIARAQARADTAASQSALADALTIAVACGLALGATLLLLAPALLSAYTGAASAAVVGPAVEYTRIRALGMPFGFVTMVSQAAFLAVKKPKQPMLAVAVASCVNLAGDLLLCCGLGLGVAGAAWATVASQVVASAVIVSRLSVPAAPGVPPLLAASAMTWLPRRAAVVAMLRVGGPVCLLIILKVLLVAVGITGAATRLSLLDSAVHGVMMTVYIFSATFGDAVSQSAQSFLPGLLGSPTAAFGLCRQLLITGAVVGTVNCACAGLVPVLSPGVFTTSAAVAAGMRQVAPTMCAALVLHSASMATEGLLLAGRDLRWLLVSYARNAALCVVTLTVRACGSCAWVVMRLTRVRRSIWAGDAAPAVGPARRVGGAHPVPRNAAGPEPAPPVHLARLAAEKHGRARLRL
jgi:Na+-driven multidrug efflux pump